MMSQKEPDDLYADFGNYFAHLLRPISFLTEITPYPVVTAEEGQQTYEERKDDFTREKGHVPTLAEFGDWWDAWSLDEHGVAYSNFNRDDKY